MQLGRPRLSFVPPHLEEGEFEREGIGAVHFRPLTWTTQPPDRAGYWWVRFPGRAECEVIWVESGFEYGSGLEWSSAPVQVPHG